MKTDSQIQSDVMTELKWDPSIVHEHIGVAVDQGVVTLAGHVPTFFEKYAAEKAAQRVAGVKAVVEDIHVKLSGDHVRDDEDIAKAVLSQLKWNVQIPANRVQATVENGWVELRGEVAWTFQKKAAENSVRHLAGVKGVTNSITLKPRNIQPESIKQKIQEALKREAEQDAKNINVEVDGSTVTLTGKVRSFAEMSDAKWAAWSSPGVLTVHNKLELNVSP